MNELKEGGERPQTQLPSAVDPKEIVHYYVDGGVRDGVAASVFVRKAFKQPVKEEVRRVFSRKVSSTGSEIRAIRLAVEDALSEGIDPSKVVIHTDQKALVRPNFRRVTLMSLLREELIGQGFNLAYIPSTHQIDETMDLSRVPKKVLNALQVHNLVKDTLDRGHNRYRYHLNKKRKRKRERRDK